MKQLPLLISLACWALLWEVGARLAGSDMFPPLSVVVASLGELLRLPSFQAALVSSARSFALGMALVVVVGIPLGALMGTFRTCDSILNVWVNIFLSAPLTAVVPALMPLLGVGETTVVATVFLFAVWVLILDTREGVRHVPTSLIEMGRVNGATRWQLFTKILLPFAVPEVMTGLRLATIRGVRGLIVGQVIIALLGFGGLFQTFLEGFRMERFWGLVLVVFALGIAVTGAVGCLEQRLSRHAKMR